MDSTGPTLYMEYRSVPSQISLMSAMLPGSSSCSWINWAKDLIRLGLPPTQTNYRRDDRKKNRAKLFTFLPKVTFCIKLSATCYFYFVLWTLSFKVLPFTNINSRRSLNQKITTLKSWFNGEENNLIHICTIKSPFWNNTLL